MNNTVTDEILSIINNFIVEKDTNKSLEDFIQKGKNPISYLTDTSKDRDTPMLESNIQVFNADILKDIYSSMMHFRDKPRSVDAIFKFSNNKIYFIEFKNGNLNEKYGDNLIDIHKKAYDTLLMLLEMNIIKGMIESNTKITFILVYNDINCYNDSRDNIYEELNRKKTDYRNDNLLKVDLLKRAVFFDSFAIDRDDFINYIIPELEGEER